MVSAYVRLCHIGLTPSYRLDIFMIYRAYKDPRALRALCLLLLLVPVEVVLCYNL
jgi:hypothetical protein